MNIFLNFASYYPVSIGTYRGNPERYAQILEIRKKNKEKIRGIWNTII